MTRGFSGALLASLAVASGALSAADLSPQAFAYGLPIVTTGDAAAYRVAIPRTVYLQSQRADLGDLQVFNGRGEPVPYAIEPPPTRTTARGGQLLPVFVLRDDSSTALNALRVTIASAGATISLRSAAAGAVPAVSTSYVLDAQRLDYPVSAMQVHWPAGAADYAGRLRLESGDTLGVWRTVIGAAPIANLHADGAQLIEDRVELPATRAKFWRLSWVGKPPPFELLSATAEPAADREPAERYHLLVAGTADARRPGEFEFDLGARPPVDRLNLELPQLNSVVQVDILARADAKAPWRHVVYGGFYRLQGPDTELRNGALGIGVTPQRFWRVRISQPVSALGNGAVRLDAQWAAPEVVFLARGSGPFTLAYGSATALGAATPLAALPANFTALPALPGAPVVLGGEQRLKPAAAAFPWKTAILWAVLATAVLLLAAMAYRLAKELNKNDAQ